MSLFRKQQPTAAPPAAPSEVPPAPAPAPPPPSPPALFDGPTVDVPAVYRAAKLTADELDRVARAEGLLHLLPSKASHTREVVDATFRAFGVDRGRIVEAARKQLQALELFVSYSQDQTQTVLDASSRRIAELEGEIERCRAAAAQATHEGAERARTTNTEMLKVQRVLDFFGAAGEPAETADVDGPTEVRDVREPKAKAEEPRAATAKL